MPQFWTNISLFPFNFTAFSGPESAILGYSWGIGSAPAADNVVALGPFTGTTQVAPAAHRLCVAMGGIRHSGRGENATIMPFIMRCDPRASKLTCTHQELAS